MSDIPSQLEPSGEDLKQEGINRSNEHHERTEWTPLVTAYFIKFLSITPGPFTIPQFKEWAFKNGLPPPNNHNAWGAFTSTKARAGLMIPTTEIRKTHLPRGHARTVMEWIREYL